MRALRLPSVFGTLQYSKQLAKGARSLATHAMYAANDGTGGQQSNHRFIADATNEYYSDGPSHPMDGGPIRMAGAPPAHPTFDLQAEASSQARQQELFRQVRDRHAAIAAETLHGRAGHFYSASYAPPSMAELDSGFAASSLRPPTTHHHRAWDETALDHPMHHATAPTPRSVEAALHQPLLPVSLGGSLLYRPGHPHELGPMHGHASWLPEGQGRYGNYPDLGQGLHQQPSAQYFHMDPSSMRIDPADSDASVHPNSHATTDADAAANADGRAPSFARRHVSSAIADGTPDGNAPHPSAQPQDTAPTPTHPPRLASLRDLRRDSGPTSARGPSDPLGLGARTGRGVAAPAGTGHTTRRQRTASPTQREVGARGFGAAFVVALIACVACLLASVCRAAYLLLPVASRLL